MARDTVNKLAMAEIAVASTWVSSWRDTMKNGGWTLSKLAEELTGKCGFKVTRSNARALVKALNIEIPDPEPAAKKSRERIIELERRVREIEAKYADAVALGRREREEQAKSIAGIADVTNLHDSEIINIKAALDIK